MKTKFKGPLFIVGLSRSGTKLLRDSLNRNDFVNIPDIETHFIPKLLNDPNMTISKAHNIVSKSLFRKRYPDIIFPSLERLDTIVSIKCVKSYIEAILKYYGTKGMNSWNDETIWGDKTPLYLRHLDTLYNAFPSGKIIHIVRDPRDRAISVKKTWNKSMYRTTEKWRRELENAQKFKHKSDFYFELRYEDLLHNPKNKLNEICDYLGIPFQEQMLELKKPSEKHGENKQKLKINPDNSKKYLDYDKTVIKRIEEIAFPYLEMYGYEPVYATHHNPYPEYMMEVKKYSDFINFIISNKVKGY